MRAAGALMLLAHGIGGRSDLPVPLWLAEIGLVLLTYAAASRATRRYAPGYGTGALAGRFVHSLLPIALGYLVAQYFCHRPDEAPAPGCRRRIQRTPGPGSTTWRSRCGPGRTSRHGWSG